MVRPLTGAGALAILLLASACSRGGDAPAENAVQNDGAANATTADMPANTAVNMSADVNAAADLSGYVGKHPSEDVNGVSFLAQSAVKSAVAATVADVNVREFVFNYNGPDAPIASKDGRLLAWGCEAHNCGFHNWSISITPDGASADVCFYQNDDTSEGRARWYLAGGKTEERPGNCPSE